MQLYLFGNSVRYEGPHGPSFTYSEVREARSEPKDDTLAAVVDANAGEGPGVRIYVDTASARITRATGVDVVVSSKYNAALDV